MSGAPARDSDLADFLAIPEATRFHELVDGQIIRKATPSGEHADAQGGVLGAVRSPFQRPPGRGGPGGWWIYAEPEIMLLDAQIVRPDVAGWRRETTPSRPTGTPIERGPDWMCEVISESNANNDTVRKLRLYHRAEIAYYWLVDPRDATLSVMRWSADGYVTRLRAERHELVRPEPFDAIELLVGTLFGDDPPG